jgi:23S rRNA-/tRNA-specific pseudouridylate synthase
MKKQTTIQTQLTILAAGAGWLAVDKPAGLSVHNDPGRDLLGRLAFQIRDDRKLRRTTGLGAGSRLNAVHRLDRETSGVILLAGEQTVHRHFAAQFEARKVDKRYHAILYGHLEPDAGTDRLIAWKWTLTKTPGGRKNPRGKGPRSTCTTLVHVLGHSDHYTLVECRLLTGRKHQIRRHARQAGHFVAGDRRYGSKRALEFLQRRRHFKRLALHASRLDIQLPGGKPAAIHAAALPGEMQRLLDEDGYVPLSGSPAPA